MVTPSIGLLLDTVHEQRLWEIGKLKHSRRDIDDVMKLVRISPLVAMPFGQCTIVPLRVPPKCEATCFVP